MEEKNLDEFVEVVLFLIFQGAYAEVTGYHFFAFGLGISRPLRQLWRRLLSLWGYDASLSVVGACVCIAVCDPASARSARWCADTSYMGKDCAWFSVFLVLVFTAVCDLISATARVGTDTAYGQVLLLSLRGSGAQRHCARWFRIRLMGKDFACLSVVLVLSAIARVGMRYVFLGKDCACLSVVLVLSATVRVVLRIRFMGKDCACLSVVMCSAPLRALVCGYGLWARITLVSPWSRYSCVQCWTSSTSRSAARGMVLGRALCTGTGPGLTPPSGRGRGGGVAGCKHDGI